jgi:hypothetical protein
MSKQMPWAKALLIVALGVCAFGDVRAQQAARSKRQVLRVVVRDSATGRVVPEVVVGIRGRPGVTGTDSAGRAVLDVTRASRYLVEARRIGYRPGHTDVEALTSDTIGVEMVLVPMVQPLAGVTVPGEREEIVARLAPFEDRRRKSAGGTFITRTDFEKWQTTHLTDALRRMPGVKIVDSLYTKFAASSRGPKPVIAGPRGAFDAAPCIMRVGMDGQIKEPTFELDELPVKEIYGVEVYPGPATIPSQFAGLRKDAFCGLIMIWTRAR